MWVAAALLVSTLLGFVVLYRASVRAERRRRVSAQLGRLPDVSHPGWDALARDVTEGDA